MKRMGELLRRFAEAEKKLLQTNFLAPTTGKGKIAVRLPNGAIYFFRAVPNFSGWGIFQPTGIDTLQLVREAHEWERLAYLEALPALRVIAVHAFEATLGFASLSTVPMLANAISPQDLFWLTFSCPRLRLWMSSSSEQTEATGGMTGLTLITNLNGAKG
jgi:hypothetical protein